ncbi:hypothetical protein LM602_05610 [Candidatus Acetothermia bacterium]|jgi:hypothetical protein|nr:hypothetical protein [Candidatus Acetothermia bacterium]MCI2432020.1 hypothetical protein [Candidatus Acetothermia bacterium]MCI2436817.1 hypothetical protein [Candidatus Acetothermia bacterium]
MMDVKMESELSEILNALQAGRSKDLRGRVGELLSELGVWEVAHRLRVLPSERTQIFVRYMEREYPAAADRIQILLTATKGEDKEFVKREFGGD